MTNIVPIPLVILFLFFLALFSFLFSASETAVIALSKIRLRNMIARGIKRAQSIQRLVTKFDKFIAAILIGNDFANIAISAVITAIFVHFFGYRLGVIAATLVSSFFVLTLCEITPKILAMKHTEKVALFTAPIMEFFIKVFHPMIIVFTGISNLILRVFGVPPQKRSPLITEEELRMMIEIGKEEGVLSDEERKMLHKIFEFGDTKVSEVMVAAEKITCVNINFSFDELLNVFVEQGYARLPVFSGTIDNIIGIIYARDILYLLRDKGLFLLQDLIHEPCFVPPGMRVNELLKKFQAEKIQMAVVAGDQKKTLGLVTLEDLIEEIVGEIEEKHENHSTNKH